MKKRVLVTGAAGRIGSAAAQTLVERGQFVRAFDRTAAAFGSEIVVADITDFNCVQEAAEGMDAIVHLAATPDDADFMSELLPNNIVPIHHVLEAARANKSRVILASTGQVIWRQHFNGPFPVRTDVPLTPRYWYAVTKVFAECAGQVYSEKHGLDVVAVRLGACPRDRGAVESIANDPITRDVYLSPGDAGRFFAATVEAEAGFGFQIVYACSKPVLRDVFDMAPARRLFGFEPRDRWPEGLPAELS